MDVGFELFTDLLGLVPAATTGALLVVILVDLFKKLGLPEKRVRLVNGLINLAIWVGLKLANQYGYADQVEVWVAFFTNLGQVLLPVLGSAAAAEALHRALLWAGVKRRRN